MPYINLHEKQYLETHEPETPGQLTYMLQQTLAQYIRTRGLSYTTLAECLGSLDGAADDLKRRVLRPYEERKQRENGDVWPATVTGGI